MAGVLFGLAILAAAGAGIDGRWALPWAAAMVATGVWVLIRPDRRWPAFASVTLALVSLVVVAANFVSRPGDQSLNLLVGATSCLALGLTIAGRLLTAHGRRHGDIDAGVS